VEEVSHVWLRKYNEKRWEEHGMLGKEWRKYAFFLEYF
jgi:hypothetical protein